MNLPKDIFNRINSNFTDYNRVLESLKQLNPDINSHRIIRCILILSESSYDSLDAWVKKANSDSHEIIRFAENDNREVQKFNFNLPFDNQKPYSYE